MKNKTYTYKSESICFIASKADSASLTIALAVENLGFDVFYLEKSHLFCEVQDGLPLCDNYIVLSRHTSATNNPAFTVHSVGNYSPELPKFGGKPSLLGYTNATLQSDLLRYLNTEKEKHKDLINFDVVLEATHHGPLLEKSLIYLEMGSSPEIWENDKCGRLLAQAVSNMLLHSPGKPHNEKVGIAFGGPHYSFKFTKLLLTEAYQIGHICPKYALPFLDENLIQQMIRRTKGEVKYAIFEKKGMKRKQEIKKMVFDLGLELIQI